MKRVYKVANNCNEAIISIVNNCIGFKRWIHVDNFYNGNGVIILTPKSLALVSFDPLKFYELVIGGYAPVENLDNNWWYEHLVKIINNACLA